MEMILLFEPSEPRVKEIASPTNAAHEDERESQSRKKQSALEQGLVQQRLGVPEM